jgi:hypothetical protein
MKSEERARQIVSQELRRDVACNDDGSGPSMYDLRIGPAEAPETAIECVGAVNQVWTETWNVGPARDPLQLSVRGDWEVVVASGTRIKQIKQHIEYLLQELETRGIPEVNVNHFLRQHDKHLFDKLESLGITHAHCFRLPGSGEVHLEMPGMSGVVNARGDVITEWIGDFLLSPQRQDVLDKLNRSGALERHVFVIVEFAGAPLPVLYYLSKNIEQLPATAPDLPAPITGVWIASTIGTEGIRWDRTGWRLFSTLLAE